MRCKYAEKSAISAALVRFQCVNCHRKFSIEREALGKMEHAVLQLPICSAAPWPRDGVGTQLKRLLSKLGIRPTADCPCNDRARTMNARGIEWCEQNIATIIGWLKEEAENRKLPFLALPTKIIVQRAIKMAKRARDKRAAQ